jgi:hypothetical protein
MNWKLSLMDAFTQRDSDIVGHVYSYNDPAQSPPLDDVLEQQQRWVCSLRTNSALLLRRGFVLHDKRSDEAHTAQHTTKEAEDVPASLVAEMSPARPAPS